MYSIFLYCPKSCCISRVLSFALFPLMLKYKWCIPFELEHWNFDKYFQFFLSVYYKVTVTSYSLRKWLQIKSFKNHNSCTGIYHIQRYNNFQEIFSKRAGVLLLHKLFKNLLVYYSWKFYQTWWSWGCFKNTLVTE